MVAQAESTQYEVILRSVLVEGFTLLRRVKEKKMRNLRTLLLRFLTAEDGPTAVEYAVMLALIIVEQVT